MSYVILTDSTTDLPSSYVVENNIDAMPLKFTINEKEYVNYLDERELPSKEFYNFMRNGIDAKTTQLSMIDIEDCYRKHLDKEEDILVVGFSSGLSGTFNALTLVAEQLREEYPARKIFLIDSLAASLGEGLLVFYANKFKQDGLSIEENYQKLENMKLHVCHWFTVDDIDTLKRGGRVSSTTAFIASTLKIKPVLHVDNEGHLIPVSKKIGRKLALKALVKELVDTIDRSYKQTIMIGHGDCLEDAKFVEELVRQEVEIEDCIINCIGPVIGSHSGPGTLALFFVGSKR